MPLLFFFERGEGRGRPVPNGTGTAAEGREEDEGRRGDGGRGERGREEDEGRLPKHISSYIFANAGTTVSWNY